MEYYIYVLIVALTITSVGTLLTIGLVLWWLYDNFPFKYIKLANSFVDDDAIASYYVSSTDLAVSNPREYDSTDVTSGKTDNQEMFNGPIGNRLKLMVKTTVGIQSSDSLFDELGTSVASDTGFPKKSSATVSSYKFIDTVVNVVGVTSGYSIDIPIRILRTPTS